MRTVVFCGGLVTRIGDVSENDPEADDSGRRQGDPLAPGQFGHNDFVLCLGYWANAIKEYFLNYKPQTYADCVVSGFGNEVDILGDPQPDWRIAMIDAGIWRNIGQRLRAVHEISGRVLKRGGASTDRHRRQTDAGVRSGFSTFELRARAKHRSTSPSDFLDTP
jgi:hypothetical protein